MKQETDIKTEYKILGVANEKANLASTSMMNIMKRLLKMHSLEDKDITQDMIVRFVRDHQSNIPVILIDDGLMDVPTAVVKFSDKAFENPNKTNNFRLIAICNTMLGMAQGLTTKSVKELRKNGRTTSEQNMILERFDVSVRKTNKARSNEFKLTNEDKYLSIIEELKSDFAIIRGLELSKPKVENENDATEGKANKQSNKIRVRFEEDTIELFCNIDCKTVEKGLRHFGSSKVASYGNCGTCGTVYSDALAQPNMKQPSKATTPKKNVKPTVINDSLLNEFLDIGKLEIVKVK